MVCVWYVREFGRTSRNREMGEFDASTSGDDANVREGCCMAFLTLLARNRLTLAGGVVMSVVVLLAVLTPVLPLADPDVTNTSNRFQPILSEGALLGTDHLGRDLLSRLMWGTRLSLAVGFTAGAPTTSSCAVSIC